MHTLVHTHQHRIDRKHNVFLLFIPGLVFVIVIGIYLLFRTQFQNVFLTPGALQTESESVDEIHNKGLFAY